MYMDNSFFRLISAALVGMLFFSFLLSKKDLRFSYDITSLWLIFLFTIVSTLSASINSDIDLAMGILLLTLMLITFTIIFPTLVGQKSNQMVYKAILYSHILIIFVPLVNGIGSPPYMGIFGNGNSFGIACVTLLAAVISKFFYKLDGYIFDNKKISKKTLLFHFIIIPSTLMLTIYSGSRTSLLTAVTITLFPIGLLILKFLRTATKRQFLKMFKLVFFGSILTGISFFIFPIKEKFEQIILYKFQLKSDDTLDERGGIWSGAFNDSTAFGNGRSYFSEFEHGAHNTYISFLGQYGWVPTVLFVLLIVFLLLVSVKYVFTQTDDELKFLPALLMVSFVMLSMGEGMLFKGIMVGAFASAGSTIVLSKKTKQLYKKSKNSVPIFRR